MKLKEIASELRSIADQGGRFGSETERALLDVASALETRPSLEVSELAALLKPKATRTKKSSSFETSASTVVGSYVAQLESLKSSADGLSVLETIMKDKRIKRPELFEVAGRFLGGRLAFKNRGEAEGAIRDRITRRDWDQGSLKIIRERGDRN